MAHVSSYNSSDAGKNEQNVPSAIQNDLQIVRNGDKIAPIGTPAHQHHVLCVLADYFRLAHFASTGVTGVRRVAVVLDSHRSGDPIAMGENIYLPEMRHKRGVTD